MRKEHKYTSVTCDRCGLTNDKTPFKMETIIRRSGSALDHFGDPACSSEAAWDFCDICTHEFNAFIKMNVNMNGGVK